MNAVHQEWSGPEPVKLRVSDFELLDKAGVFEGRYKVELIEGMIVATNAEYLLHGVVKNRLVRALQRVLERNGSDLEALNEITVQLDDHSVPQPDAIVAHVSLDRRYSGPSDIALAIEVADHSLSKDLKKKAHLYAAAGIPEYWIVDLRSMQLHRFWTPRHGSYAETSLTPLHGELRSATIPYLAIDGSGIQ